MTIQQNQFVEELEQAWDNLNWERKFEHSNPVADIEYVWHAYSKEEVEEAKKILPNLQEDENEGEAGYIARSAHLGSWSSGEAIVICKHCQEDEEE